MSDVTINTYDDDGVFGVVFEGRDQAPILWEGEGIISSREAAQTQMNRMKQRGDCVRVCLVRLIYVSGNELLLKDMQRMQK